MVKSESNSIGNQRELIRAFIMEQSDMELYDIYVDDGFSGSNFERPEFKRMLIDIEAGRYIQKVFPALGVRFIALTDHYDSDSADMSETSIILPVKNFINDMYAKDASVKLKQSLRQRRQAGGYVGGPAPYGYLFKYEENVRKLIPDENTADIVRYIFERFIQTASCSAVADDLNRRRINSPTVYRQTGEVFFSEKQGEHYRGWNRCVVDRIVNSETYTGKLVQGKTSITARDENNRIHKPESEWCIKENAHEPLIDVGMFEQAKETLQKIHDRSRIRNHPAEGCAISEDIFDEVLYCGVCGKKMTRYSQIKTYQDTEKRRVDGYFCLNSGQTRVDICPETNRILKEPLVDILMQLFRAQFAMYLKKPKKYVNFVQRQLSEKRTEMEKRRNKVLKNMEMFREKEAPKYMQYKEGEISQKEYVAYKMQQEDKKQDLDRQLAQIEDDVKKADILAKKVQAMVRSILHLRSGKELTKEMVKALVDRIYVYPGKRVEILWGYTDELLQEVLKYE